MSYKSMRIRLISFWASVILIQTVLIVESARKWKVGSIEDLTCHNHVLDDEIPTVHNSSPPLPGSIFFAESTCRSYRSVEGIHLTTRQACAVESAALRNPNVTVYVLFISPVKASATSELTNILLQYKNVVFRRFLIEHIAKNSPVRKIVNRIVQSSDHPVFHIADLMRLLTLWKYPGVYLDMDTISVQGLDKLPSGNWVGAENYEYLSTGAIALRDSLGNIIATDTLIEIAKTYHPYEAAFNGRGALERILMEHCVFSLPLPTIYPANCTGIEILPPQLVCPVPSAQADWYLNGSMSSLPDNVVLHHIWGSKITRRFTHELDAPLAVIAKTNCPKVYEFHPSGF